MNIIIHRGQFAQLFYCILWRTHQRGCRAVRILLRSQEKPNERSRLRAHRLFVIHVPCSLGPARAPRTAGKGGRTSRTCCRWPTAHRQNRHQPEPPRTSPFLTPGGPMRRLCHLSGPGGGCEGSFTTRCGVRWWLTAERASGRGGALSVGCRGPRLALLAQLLFSPPWENHLPPSICLTRAWPASAAHTWTQPCPKLGYSVT